MEVRFCPFCASPQILNHHSPGNWSCIPCGVKRFEVVWQPTDSRHFENSDDVWDDPMWDRVRVELVKNTPAKGGV